MEYCDALCSAGTCNSGRIAYPDWLAVFNGVYGFVTIEDPSGAEIVHSWVTGSGSFPACPSGAGVYTVHMNLVRKDCYTCYDPTPTPTLTTMPTTEPTVTTIPTPQQVGFDLPPVCAPEDTPDAGFHANQTNGPAPLTVQFTDDSSGFPIAWYWEFGDGGTSKEQNPVYTYSNPGTYDVTLRVSDDDACVDEITEEGSVTVTEAAHCGYNSCNDFNNLTDYYTCVACNDDEYCDGLCINSACDISGTNVTFGIDNYTCSGEWQKAYCGQNAFLNWALTGDSKPFEDSLSIARWRKTIDCPVIGHSYAFDNPAGKDVYFARIKNMDIDLYPNNSFNHEVAVELPAGQNKSVFDSWRFFNYGNLNIIMGDQQMPVGGNQCNTEIVIKKITRVYGCLEYEPADVEQFYIDSNGNIVSSQLGSCPSSVTEKSLNAAHSQKKYSDLPDELKPIVESIKNSHEFGISRWDVDSINKSMIIFIYNIRDEQMIDSLNGKTVDGYSIQIVHDIEFERTRDDVRTQLLKFRENPDYQINGISMGTNAFGISNSPEYYAEVWVNELTPENRKLDNTLIDGWTIQVIRLS